MGDNVGDGLLFGSEAHLPPRTQAPAPPHLSSPSQPPPPRSPVECFFFSSVFFWLIKILFLVGWLVFALKSISHYGEKSVIVVGLLASVMVHSEKFFLVSWLLDLARM